MVCLWSQPVQWLYTLTPLCSHFLNPHQHIMVTARKYHLHFHTIVLSFCSKIHSIYMEIPFNLESTHKTRQNVLWLVAARVVHSRTPTNLLPLLEVSQPIWNLSSKPKTSQDGVFTTKETTFNSVVRCFGVCSDEYLVWIRGSGRKQRVWKVWYSRNVV